nr:YqiA/YcfP family alpha/beta fold hydrolase [uncultured Prevotella sp.]
MNPYIKQYPDLMSGKKIMYVHGFLSSAASGTVKMLQELMPQATIVADDIPVHPEEAMTFLRAMAERERPDLIIGTSMGGMMTEMLTGYDRVLVNPAFEMGDTMSNMTGRQEFQNPRKDGVQELMVNKGLIKEYKDITRQCFAQVTLEEQQRVYGLFGDNDPVVHTFDLFHAHYPNAIRFHGEHRLIDKVAVHYLVPVIRWIDDRQNKAERPIVYIDFACLHDAYDHPTSSMHKAYEMLLEHYNVFIVAPAPTNDHASLTRVQDWCEEYLSAPAYNHVLFANQKALLYGDYFIDSAPASDFMGTGIAYGSDEFKTWEEIITFFERLGGQ